MDVKHLGSIKGIAQIVMVIGSMLRPLPLGFAYEQLVIISIAISLLINFPVLGVIAAFISPPQKNE